MADDPDWTRRVQLASAQQLSVQTALARAVYNPGTYKSAPIPNSDMGAGLVVWLNTFNVDGTSGFYTYTAAAAFPEVNATFPQGFFSLLSKTDSLFNGDWMDWTYAGSGDLNTGTTSGNGGWPRHPSGYVIFNLDIATNPLEIEFRYAFLA